MGLLKDGLSFCLAGLLTLSVMFQQQNVGRILSHYNSMMPGTARKHGRKGGGTMVFDVGFNNGDDTNLLLSLGYQVVAVEANPVLVQAGRERFAKEIEEGRLVIESVALPMDPDDSTNTTSQDDPLFYISRREDQWSSFVFSVGCRGDCWNDREQCNGFKANSHKDYRGPECCASLSECEVKKLRVIDCGELYDKYGVPYMLKLDIEGAERGCITALKSRAQKPRILTVEVNPMPGLFEDMLELGYTQVKIVEQDASKMENELGVSSGPLGELAQDCALGYNWRSLRDLADRLVFGVKVGKQLCDNAGRGWYDWHFRNLDPNPPGLGVGTLAQA